VPTVTSARRENVVAGGSIGGDLPEAPCLAFCSVPSATDDRKTQNAILSQGASAEAITAARDLIFEGLVEAGALAESYSRSLTEAAWRGDRSTVEVHLRQLRSCVLASIDFFKRLDGSAKAILLPNEGSAP
jgi:hypothetical protein